MCNTKKMAFNEDDANLTNAWLSQTANLHSLDFGAATDKQEKFAIEMFRQLSTNFTGNSSLTVHDIPSKCLPLLTTVIDRWVGKR